VAAQFAEPAVSLAKFEQEIADFQSLADEYRRNGWFLLDASFPQVLVAFAAPQLNPPAIVCGALVDYSNYDAEPPSVHLVNPFTREPYLAKELPTSLNRAVPAQSMNLPGVPGEFQLQGAQPLMQAYGPDSIPFLCIAGVREYHQHPAHSGDAWELHRSAGAGRLVRLLEVIHTYGVKPLTGYSVNLVPQVGLEFGEPPA
jgi:Predicted metal binding domain